MCFGVLIVPFNQLSALPPFLASHAVFGPRHRFEALAADFGSTGEAFAETTTSNPRESRFYLLQQPMTLLCLKEKKFFRGSIDSSVGNIERRVVNDFTPSLRYLVGGFQQLYSTRLQFRLKRCHLRFA